MKKNSFLLVAIAFAVILGGCSALHQAVQQAVALKDCKYAYSRMSDVTFMDMNPNEMATFGGAAKLAMGLLGSQPAPLGFTIHLRVTNPNEMTAAMESMYYKVSLDSVEVAEGASSEPVMVVGGGL